MINAINDWVFTKRNSDITGIGDIVVGEGAYAKNQRAVVFSSSSPAFSVGDTVLLPHYKGMVVETVVDGESYTAIKSANIIAVMRDGKPIPVNKNILVRKCTNDHIRDESGAIALYMHENYIENTQWVEILDFAEDVETIPASCIGWFCQAPESSDGLQRVESTKDYMLKEDLIEFITDGG